MDNHLIGLYMISDLVFKCKKFTFAACLCFLLLSLILASSKNSHEAQICEILGGLATRLKDVENMDVQGSTKVVAICRIFF